jgi:predicted nucleotidyltransferase
MTESDEMVTEQFGRRLDSVAEASRGLHEINVLYLFGSLATGRANCSSDVDLGVLFCADVTPERYPDLKRRCIGELASQAGKLL